MPEGRNELFALLVGIDQYINQVEAPLLDGCVNDVNAMEQTLRGRFGVPEENILKLTNHQATYQEIISGFRKALIDKAREWHEQGKQEPSPAFLFHYSGHGSQAIDETGTEPDGLDETLVAHDSRTPGVYDIKDWELSQLLEELTQYSDNVTVVLDCCHSGSGTRAANGKTTKVRRCQPDLRPQPSQRPPGKARTRAVNGPSDWFEGGRYVLIAGCRDREESNEHTASGSAYRT